MAWPYVGMAELETRLRERADLSTSATNPQYVTSSEAQTYIQKSWEKLYSYLVGKYEDYFIKFGTEANLFQKGTTTAGLAAGVKDYNFDTDYMKLVKLCLRTGIGTRSGLGGDYEWTLKKISVMEEHRYLNPDDQNKPRLYILHGRAVGASSTTDKGVPNGLRLLPTPDAAYNMDVIYIPRPPVITSGLELAEGLDFIAGWDEYVVTDAVIKVKDKREDDTSVLIEERADFLRTIEDAISPRDAGQPHEVVAVRDGFDAVNEDIAELYID